MDEGQSHEVARNPYAPPASPVADVAVIENRGPRPAQVSWAVRLLWVDLALSVLQAGRGWSTEQGLLSNLLAVGLSAVLLACEAWIILKISAGRNWARWVALVCIVVGVPLGLLMLAQTSQASSIDVALDGVATCTDVIALYLVFFSPGRQWFRQRLP